MKKAIRVLLCALLLLALTGCDNTSFLFRSPESLFALPQLSEEYTSLQAQLKELLDSGMEYSPPLSGDNTQPVHLRDLDGDGEEEAVAFLRETETTSAPLKIVIFRKNLSGEFKPACILAGEGTNFNSVLACQLIGDANSPQELIVSWQASSSLYSLSAYSLVNFQPVELITCPRYTRYSVTDLDEDSEEELVVMSLDRENGALHSADYYDRVRDTLALKGTASLSSSLSSLDRIQTGRLSDGSKALYVTGSVLSSMGSSTSQITDVLAPGEEEGFENLTLDPATLNSDITIRSNLAGVQDINGDGVLELPSPFSLPSYDRSASEDGFYGISWQQFDSDGTSSFVCSTFYNSADGWYLELPEDWQSHFALARQDTVVGSTNERGILFYYRDGPSKGQPFLAFYKNTGTNMEKRAVEGKRVLIALDENARYSMELLDSNPALSLSPGDLVDRFHLITQDWSMD
jgi:hypothetical protein